MALHERRFDQALDETAPIRLLLLIQNKTEKDFERDIDDQPGAHPSPRLPPALTPSLSTSMDEVSWDSKTVFTECIGGLSSALIHIHII